MKFKILSGLISLAFAVSIGANSAYALSTQSNNIQTLPTTNRLTTPLLRNVNTTAAHQHCVCGGSNTTGDHKEHTNITYTPWDGTTALSTDGNYYLTKDITLSSVLNIDKNINLCLNGHMINSTGENAIKVSGTLNLSDCNKENITHKYYIDTTKQYVFTDNIPVGKDSKTLNGGVITCNGTANGGGISVASGGKLNLYGGTIAGCKGANGGGIYSEGAVKLYGGAILGNIANTGGGVYIKSGTIDVLEHAVVSSNYSSDKNSNLYLAKDIKINITEAITEEGKVGITLASDYAADKIFTTGSSKNYKLFFVTDDGNFIVVEKSNQLALEPVYSLKYDVNTGTGTAPVDNKRYPAGEKVILYDGAGLSKTDYLFKGWALTSDATTPVSSPFAISSPTSGNEIKLYAVWALDIRPVTPTALAGLTAPVKLAAPDLDIENGIGWTAGAVEWKKTGDSGALSGNFLGGTAYTATVKLTTTEPKYTFKGITGSFTHPTGTVTVKENTENTLTLEVSFAATAARELTQLKAEGTPTTLSYAIGETFDLKGIALTAVYDDGTSETITSGYTIAPEKMKADTNQVTITYNAVASKPIGGFTIKENLTSITAPSDILNVANGTAKTAQALGLPSTVKIVTSKTLGAIDTANVTSWDISNAKYDPSSAAASVFEVTGTVTLPTELTNVNNVSLSIKVKVSVNKANVISKPQEQPTDKKESISGIAVDQSITEGTGVKLIVKEFTRGDKTYAPLMWSTNPSGIFTENSGTYSATIDTTNMTVGKHNLVITYRELVTSTRVATGNIVETSIGYSIAKRPEPTPEFKITATVGKGGYMSTPEIVKVFVGESAGFTITPDKGYQIADVKVDGKSIGAKNYYVFTKIMSDHTISATFKKIGATEEPKPTATPEQVKPTPSPTAKPTPQPTQAPTPTPSETDANSAASFPWWIIGVAVVITFGILFAVIKLKNKDNDEDSDEE